MSNQQEVVMSEEASRALDEILMTIPEEDRQAVRENLMLVIQKKAEFCEELHQLCAKHASLNLPFTSMIEGLVDQAGLAMAYVAALNPSHDEDETSVSTAFLDLCEIIAVSLPERVKQSRSEVERAIAEQGVAE